MSLIPEQISAAAQTQLTNQLDAIQAISNAAFGGLEKIFALHINTAKQSFDAVNAATQQLLAASTPQELLALTTARTQPQLDAIMSYGREMADISINARTTFLQAVSTSGSPIVTTVEFNFPPKKETVVKSAGKAKTESKSADIIIDIPAITSSTPQVAQNQQPSAEKVAPATATEKQLPLLADTESQLAAPVAVATVTPPAPASAVTTPAATKATTTSAQTATKPSATVAKTTKPAAPKSSVAATRNTPATTVASVTPTSAPAKISTEKPAVANKTEKAVPEKKSVVKFPFPPTPKTQNGKPVLASTSNKPAYKAKASAATGAKKPVRQ